ncbi:MAG: fluoroacetyl-CoA thioesterase [Actinomycetota bacterium]|nr:fluoroacetyl-CoA thioesterase [Actinomycetota bacterium]
MARIDNTVTDDDTAVVLGSGDVPVLATPRVVAWLEAATCEAAREAGRLDPGQTSVGTRVDVEHLLATPVGGRVEAVADLTHADGRLLRFAVSATDGAGRVIATGEVTRVVVDRERFLARVPRDAG